MSLTVSNSSPYATGTDTIATTSKFVPEIWSGKMQVKFYSATCLSEVTNNDWEGEIKDTGDKVHIRSIPNITISAYTKGLELSTELPSSTPLELLIDKGKYFAVLMDDVDAAQSDMQLVNMFSDDAAEQMKISIETDVFAAVGSSAATRNKGNSAGAISQNIRLGATSSTNPCYVNKTAAGTGAGTTGNAKAIVDHIVDIGLVLDEQNVPETGRWVLVPASIAARIKTSELKQAYLTGDSQSPLRNGKLGIIDRFTIYVSNNLPKSGSELTILAGTRDAISFASQLTKVEKIRSTTRFGDILRGLNVFGYKVTKPEALVYSIVVIE